MKDVTIKSLVDSVSIDNKLTRFVLRYRLLERIVDNFLSFKDVNKFLRRTENWSGIEFIEELFDYIDFSFTTTHKDKQKIPSEGRLIVVANHPLGGLDALSLICGIYEVRQDIKILANEMLTNIEQLNEFIIPVDVFSKSQKKSTMVAIHKAMIEEKVLIIFPAGEVSRLRSGKVMDGDWSKSTISIAKKYGAPILPVFIKAQNSVFFYMVSKLNKRLSTALLPREIFKKAGERISIKIGDIIPSVAISNYMKDKLLIKLLKKHVYRIAKDKKEIFMTEKNVIHPQSQKTIKVELNMSRLLVNIDEKTKLYTTKYQISKNVINEISRLRELTYRKVGEGTGNKSDKDNYDKICDHLILWNNDNIEIIGSYRLGDLSEIIANHGYESIYNHQLYEFSLEFEKVLENTLELGRSFIQQKYWRTNALDYLWQGIGAYVIERPHIKYMFGAVSLSDSYSELAKNLIVFYYQKWYSEGVNSYLKAKYPYEIPKLSYRTVLSTLNGADYKEDFINLKKSLSELGYSVPVLLRKYTDLCEYGGVKFLGFGIDESFNNSIDCVVLLDLDKIKPEFKERYFNNKKLNKIIELV
ncbi:MAG: lysophospholipid acyltransferase family protein [Candidatus Kapaibacterium sp.]